VTSSYHKSILGKLIESKLRRGTPAGLIIWHSGVSWHYQHQD